MWKKHIFISDISKQEFISTKFLRWELKKKREKKQQFWCFFVFYDRQTFCPVDEDVFFICLCFLQCC